MHCLYTNYTSNNPGGIEINLGYYALCECIVKGTWASTALSRWCGVWNDRLKPRKKYVRNKSPRKPMGEKTKKILKIYEKHPEMRNTQIARLVKCTPEMVGKVLHSIGVRRNRWDGYISQDPRYSKEKRGNKNEHE